MSNFKSLLLAQLCGLLFTGAVSAKQKTELLLPLGHTNSVSSVAFSPDGKSVLTGSNDDTARLWDVATGKAVQTFTGHTNSVSSVAFSPDGTSILTGSNDKTARLWDVAAGKAVQTFTGHMISVSSVAFSPDGKTVLTGSGDKTVRLWDITTGKTTQTFTGHGDDVTSVAFSPDGRRVLTGSYDDTARLWDAATGKAVQTFTGHMISVSSVAFSPDGKTVLTGSGDKTARLWDITTGKTTQTFTGHINYVSSVVFSPDGKTVLTASGDYTARLWDSDNGKTTQTFTGLKLSVSSVAFSPDGKSVLTDRLWGKTAQLWDIATGKTTQTFTGHTGGVFSAAFSPDGKSVLTGSWDKTARLWDITTGKTTQTFTGHSGRVSLVAFMPDGKSVFTSSAAPLSRDYDAQLWDIATGKTIQTFTGHINNVCPVVFSPDGKTVLTASGDNTARLCDIATGKTIQTFTGHTNLVSSVAFSPDGRRVLTGSYDDTARLWDAATGKAVQTFTGHVNYVSSVAFSPDGKTVLTASGDFTARLWDSDNGKRIMTFTGHTARVTRVVFSPDVKSVFTWSDDGTARLWNGKTGEELYAFLADSDYHLAWTPEGYYTGSLEAEKLIAWKVEDKDDPRGYRIVGPEQFRDTFYRPDLFKHLLTEGSVEKALAKADAERGVKTVPTTVAKEIPPFVIVTAPKKLSTVMVDEIEIEAVAGSVTEHPIESLQLEVNGQPTGRVQKMNDPKPGQVNGEWPLVKLQPGENEIQVFARAGGSVGRSEVVKVTRVAAEEKKVRLHLLVIAVGQYKPAKEGEPRWMPLPNAAGDARRFADAFVGAGKGLYSEVMPPMLLLDAEGTKDNILDALEEFNKAMTVNDVGVIFFAGHGVKSSGVLYLAAHDSDKSKLTRSGLPVTQLRSILAGTKGRKYLFLDACHSGGAVTRGDESFHDDIVRELRTEATGMVIAAACQEGEEAHELNNAGIFTTAVVEGITGKAAVGNGAVYGRDLASFVKERVKALTKEHPKQPSQRPLFDGPDVLMDLPLAKPGVKK